MRKTYDIEIDCANCARRVEQAIAAVDGVESVSLVFVDKKMYIEIADDRFDDVMKEVDAAAHRAEDGFSYRESDEGEDDDDDEDRYVVPKIVVGLIFVAIGLILEHFMDTDIPDLYLRLIFLAVLIAVGSAVFVSGIRSLVKGGFLDEHFLMSVASLAAIAIGYYTE